MNKLLIIVDPQNDFCDPEGSLYVPNAEKDCDRIAGIIKENEFDDIIVTLDMHHAYSIFHDIFWLKDNKPFFGIATINKSNFLTEFKPKHAYDLQFAYDTIVYKRKSIDVWPVHCVIGGWGSNINNKISKELLAYSLKYNKKVNYAFKGTNSYQDEYSAFSFIDVYNTPLIHTFLNEYKNENVIEIYICGEAASHCVKETIKDILKIIEMRSKCANMKEKIIIKLITNATSYVTGFESVKEDVYDKINDPHFEMITI